MTRRKARRLYADALESYCEGYIAGTQGAIWNKANPDRAAVYRLCSPYGHESKPAYSTAYDAGFEGRRVDTSRLPLDVWVRVLAKEAEPR